MDKLRILVVENQENWSLEVFRILQRLDGAPQIDLAKSFQESIELIGRHRYDLAVVDLALQDNPDHLHAQDELGLKLLQELHQSHRNQGCGAIVLTGYPSSSRTKTALRDYVAYDFIEKDNFSSKAFLESARGAIADARLRSAVKRAEERYRLTISFGRERLSGVTLIGPDRRMHHSSDTPQRFLVTDLARRADNLNLLILKGGPDLWRPEARSTGDAIAEALASDRRIYGDLVTAQALAHRFSDLWIEFSGPAEGLGIPFELLRDQNEYLALNHMITRRLDSSSIPLLRKTDSFPKFVQQLVEHRQPLRALIVAANSDKSIPGVEEETAAIEGILRTSLMQLGIQPQIDLLVGEQANYQEVVERLRSGIYHLFHYAGHGRFDDHLPEISGLVLRNGNQIRTLTASDLKLLVHETPLRLVFLSCCLGARTAERVGRGDFQGMMEALAQADVPIVAGYRWTVGDQAALEIAANFYHVLWRTLSPAEAMLKARHQAAAGPQGRDDDSWASPVLLIQNA